MKLIFIIACLLACIVSDAGAHDLYSDNRTIEEVRMANLLHKHVSRPILAGNSIGAIDGRKPVIIISDARTGLPDEFEERVAHINKMKERYGR